MGSHVVLLATDKNGLKTSQSFKVVVANTNDAPIVTSTAVTTATEDSAYTYTFAIDDPDAGVINTSCFYKANLVVLQR